MKTRISATIDPETNKKLEKILKKGKHRNKSHIIEDIIKKYTDEDEDE